MKSQSGAASAIDAGALGDGSRAAIRALLAVLHELAEVVHGLTREQYTAASAVPGTIGGHVRHTLDHVGALLAAADSNELDYDTRERGTPVECDPEEALIEIERLAAAAERLDGEVLSRPLRIPVVICGDGTRIHTQSTLGRELAFVVSHAIHHNALIAAILSLTGQRVPPRFGYAPATLAHLNHAACVPSPLSR